MGVAGKHLASIQLERTGKCVVLYARPNGCGLRGGFGYPHPEEDAHSGYKLTFYGETKTISNLLH